MVRRGKQAAWSRRYRGGFAAAGVLAAALAAFMLWPRGPVYADYVDGARPTIVFVWSDPTPHHPHG